MMDDRDRPPVLEARGLTVRRGARTVFENLSLSVPRGAKVLVRGRSGAGKTTLFNVLGLLDTPTEGRLWVDGTDVSHVSERRRARFRRESLGYVFQEFNLIPDLTARENVALPQEHAGSRDDAWLDTLFDRLEIAHLEDQYPATLSGGEKQRVAIARAIANRPTLVLADEPTGQLDPRTAEAVLDLLFELHERTETGLLVASHDRALADRFPEVVRLDP